MARILTLAAFGALVILAAGCRRDPGTEKISKQEKERLLSEYERKKKEEAARPASRRLAAGAAGRASAPADAGTTPKEAPPRTATETPEASDMAFVIDEPTPIAPAAPACATPRGVAIYNRRGEAFLAKLGKLSKSAKSTPTPVAPLPKTAAPFPLGRAPAVLGEHAVWVSDGKLVRKALSSEGTRGDLEVLASDAQNGTRVAVPLSHPNVKPAQEHRAAVYIVRAEKEDGPLRAKLWVEGADPVLLTPEGSSTHNVALVATSTGLLSVSLQARMAMTPIHARPIRFEKGKPRLDEDVVVWVGGGVQPMTEIAVVAGPGEAVWGYLPHERSITEFGLAELAIGARPDMETPVRWIAYPNGLDPAPVATGYVCDEPAVVYAQPESADPDSPQELVLKTLGATGSTVRLSGAKAFFDVSLSSAPGGALVAYVADWVTFALTVRCREKKRKG